jgi:hypothetical protein
MFFKQVMSDFAFNRILDKTRKLAKSDPHTNTAVIASLNETIAKKYVTGTRLKSVEQLLTDCIAIFRKHCAAEQDERLHAIIDSDDNNISFCCVETHAIIEKDVEADFYSGDDLMNKIKILVNLKLLPEHFLSIDSEYV